MASCVEYDLQCLTCLVLVKEPVVLPCSHSFCRACVQLWCEEKGDSSCPVCGKKSRSVDPPRNMAQNVLPILPQASDICTLHKEKLTRFCLEHNEPVCLRCKDEQIHAGHRFHPVNKAAKEHKNKLREGLQHAKERRDEYNEIRKDLSGIEAYIKTQRDQVEKQIKKDFAELHHFLKVEEKARLSAVKEEEQKKTRAVKEKLKALDKELDALSNTISSAEARLKLASAPVSFLKNFQTVMTGIQKLPDLPEQLLRGALLDEAKHVGNLKFSVWEQMKEEVSYSRVILDPNTARPELSLSGDLTSVSFGKIQPRPNNPERFTRSSVVLGSTLAAGTHTWDVDVGDNPDWEVGVAWGDPCSQDSMQTRSIAFCHGEHKQFDGPLGSWNPPVKLQRIRVHVDTKKNWLLFSEPLANKQLCKLNHWPPVAGNVKLFPYFRTRDKNPLKIIPLARRVTIPNRC